jgi:hypothetical protein
VLHAQPVMLGNTSGIVGLQTLAHVLPVLPALLVSILKDALERPAGPALTVLPALMVSIFKDALERPVGPALPAHVLLVNIKQDVPGRQVVHALHVMQDTTVLGRMQLITVPCAQVENTPPFLEHLLQVYVPRAPPARLVSTQ